ncbi:MAG: methyltransferase [Euryarchaeota archaeon]|nr:methyltransferase [Euryarchaeota archaeon]
MPVRYRGYELEIAPGVYTPREDSLLLADQLQVPKGARVLDLGTGCGIQGIVASARAGRVLAADINPGAVRCAEENARLNGVENMTVVEGDLFDGIEGRFDLIAFNPPYLPTEPWEPRDMASGAWDGGMDGREVVDRFLEDVVDHLSGDGSILLVQSSLNDPPRTVNSLREQALKVRIVAERAFFFERLYLLEARP